MAKLDVYLRSIERFGAAGALLASGQAVTLKFPTGDRHATQVTPHDLLVGIVREVAPPQVLEQIDKNRPARFEHESNGARYVIGVAPRPGAWQVSIASATAAPAEPARAAPPPQAQPAAAPSTGAEMPIERGQYESGPVRVVAGGGSSGSGVLDELTRAARAAHATDVFLAADVAPIQRVGNELVGAAGATLDGDRLARELGLIAPPEARALWTERGGAVFAYGDGVGRVRVALARDHRGPTAALRLLPDEAPPLDQIGLRVDEWLGKTGLVVIAGPSGAGKTVAMAAIVRALGERKRRVVTIEDPIELVHLNPWISQREVGPHVVSIPAGVTSAMLEGADAIAVGAVTTTEAASAVVDAVAGGHFVVTTVVAPGASGLERIVDLLALDRREVAREIATRALLGTVIPAVTRAGRTFEIMRSARPG